MLLIDYYFIIFCLNYALTQALDHDDCEKNTNKKREVQTAVCVSWFLNFVLDVPFNSEIWLVMNHATNGKLIPAT